MKLVKSITGIVEILLLGIKLPLKEENYRFLTLAPITKTFTTQQPHCSAQPVTSKV